MLTQLPGDCDTTSLPPLHLVGGGVWQAMPFAAAATGRQQFKL
jgi:hypothetical protein